MGCAKPEPAGREKVIEAAHRFVAGRLASQGRVAFGGEADILVEDLGDGRYRVTGPLDYGGETGSMRSTFHCVLVHRGRGQFDCQELTFE